MPFRSRSVLPVALFLAASLVFVGCDSSGSNGENGGADNAPPSADVSVSPGTTVDVGEQVTLDGSGSSDPDGDDLSFSWTLSTPDGSSAELSSTDAEQPTFTPDVAGDYTATLEVSDGEASDTDDATITGEAAVQELGSNITSDRTLTAESRYLVTASCVGIENGATLTIEAGVHMEFEANACISVNDDNSALVASGTEDNPITMVGTESNPEGWWKGVASYSSNPNNELNWVEIEDAGSESWNSMDRAASVAVNTDKQLTLTNSTISNGGSFGLHLDEASGDLTFSSNTFSGNAIGPVNVPFTAIGTIDAASSFEDGTYVRVWGANPSSGDVTVEAISVPYRINGTPTLSGNATVTIDPGVQMEFTANSNLTIDGSGAALIAAGTESNPITMVGTDSDPEGWWQGVASYSSNPNNELNWVEIEDAGSESWNSMDRAASVAVNTDKQLTLTNSTISNGGGFGLHLDEASGDLTFSSNTFSGNAIGPVNVPFTAIGTIDAASSFEDGTYVRVWGANPSSGDVTVEAIDVPYRMAGASDLRGTVTVTIDPGVQMEFTSNSNLTVGSNDASLDVNGESGNRVVMTATPGNRNSGFWQGVGIYSSNPNNEIDYARIEYAGSQSWGSMDAAANIGLNRDAQLTLGNSEINDSGQHGVHCDEPNQATFTTDGPNDYSGNAGNNVNGCNTN